MATEYCNRASPRIGRRSARVGALLAVLIGAAAGARADLVVSAGATANVTCGGGTCTATAADAVLNAGTLQTMLASGNVTVTTAAITDMLVVDAPIAWSSASTLSLTAKHAIAVDALIVVRGLGGLALSTDNGAGLGNLAFTSPGRVKFNRPLSKLTINGLQYKLVTSIAGLAAAAAANENARVALADNYDAKPDGTYRDAPVTYFDGLFEGLGNTISNLNIASPYRFGDIGLFREVYGGGRVDGIALVGVSVSGVGRGVVGGLVGVLAGGLVGVVTAEISHSSVKGLIVGSGSATGGLVGRAHGAALVVQSHSAATVEGHGHFVGGLIGENRGTVRESYALGNVSARRSSTVGGLVGLNEGTIRTSFAIGAASARAFGSGVGGLVGKNTAVIENCYATGGVKNSLFSTHGTPLGSDVGGLVGVADAAILISYSSGAVTGAVGGLVGFDGSGGMRRDYWDFSTSGVTSPSAGAGNIANDPGITGQTTAQLTAKLPAGFSPTVWALNPNINGGRPYLIANPPPS